MMRCFVGLSFQFFGNYVPEAQLSFLVDISTLAFLISGAVAAALSQSQLFPMNIYGVDMGAL